MAIDDTLPTLDKYATLMIPGKDPIKLPILKGTLGPEVIDIRELGKQGFFTYDPGFVSTASCMSRITFIDGKKGVLLYRGYPIDQLATKCDYLEVCYLLFKGELPNKEQYHSFVDRIKHHTLVHTQMESLFQAFRRDSHPMAVLCGVKDTGPNLLICTVLLAGTEQEQNGIYQSFIKFGADSVFWQMVAQVTGYREKSPDLGRLSCHILMTAVTRTMRMDNLVGLDSFISIPHQSYCYDFMSDWIHSDETRELYSVSRNVEDELRLPARFSQLPLEELTSTEIFPCIDECILKKMMTDIIDNTINVDAIIETVGKRRTLLWYSRLQNFYEGVLNVAYMQKFYLEHSAGFHTVEPHKVWKEYTEDYYRMDTYYRLFHVAFEKSLNSSNPLLDDLFKHVADVVEGLYANWFLGNLGTNWATAAADNLKDYGRIMEVPQQNDFYRNRVKNADTRVFVLISDAMRYEVAATLAQELERDIPSEVQLTRATSPCSRASRSSAWQRCCRTRS